MSLIRFTATFLATFSLMLFTEAEGISQEKKVVPPTLWEYRTKEREKLLKQFGGTAETEEAVSLGLIWLARQQKNDGHWEFDGSNVEKVAATAMTLLPFLAAGEIHTKNSTHQKVVKNGLNWLLAQQKADGSFNGAVTMYTHGLATIALCDAYALSGEDKVKTAAQKATNFVMSKQGKNGSWGYAPGTNGDTSIVGWQVQALHSGQMAKLRVNKKTMDNARDFLVSVATESESQYGYASKGGTPSLSAVGLLCRQYMGLSSESICLEKGVEYLKKRLPVQTDYDLYYYYYATQVIRSYGGSSWKKWNQEMIKLLLPLQETKEGARKGSWPKDNSHIGTSCGHLGTTSLAILTLQVYYRYPLPEKFVPQDDLGYPVGFAFTSRK